MYLKSTSRTEMIAQIDFLNKQLEQQRIHNEREVHKLKNEHSKELVAVQDELKKTQEAISNVQFQQYFKMKNENKKLLQENQILREMLRASQITVSTKELELSRLKQKFRRLEGSSLEIRQSRPNYRQRTQPSLLDSTTDASMHLLQQKK